MDYLSAITSALGQYGSYKTANNTAESQSQLAQAQLAQQTALQTASMNNQKTMLMLGGGLAVVIVLAVVLTRH